MAAPLLAAAIFAAASPAAGADAGSGEAPARDASGVGVERLQTEAAENPLGIDSKAPRFSWRLRGGARGTLQSAYRVVVATRAELVKPGAADVWDSGEVKTSEPWCVYSGPTLRSRTRYHWSVHVTTGAGAVSDPRTAWFETALVDPSEWRAQWIAGPERAMSLTPEEGLADDERIGAAGELCRPVGWLTRGFASRIPNDQGECRELRPAPLLRQSFLLKAPVARARLYASGLAYGRLLLNGKPVSNRVLDPAFTNYSKTVLYTTDDVTALVRPGENVVAAELGSGHFDDATRTWDWGWTEAEWRGTPRLRLELLLVYEDGREQLVVSDGSWRTSVDGPRRYDSLYLGETYDARREKPGWAEPGFDDSGWAAARVVSGPAGVPRAQMLQPIEVVSERPSGARSEPLPGVFVYDVGQNLTGWAEIRVRAPAGTAVEVFYSEKLDEQGRASTRGNDLVHGQLQTDYYVARGHGEETSTPAFSYKGFQYVQLSGPGGAPLPAAAEVSLERVLQVRSALPRTSSFESSRPTLDRIHHNATWAIESNFHGVITDTPVYEKNPWTGDAHFTAGAASILFDTERLYRKLFQDMVDAQAETGELPLLCPSNRNYGYVGKPAFKPVDCCGATPAWDAFWFVVPWESYMRHGDRGALERVYPAMRRYLDEWVPRWTGKDGDAFHGTLTSGLGDWVAPRGVPTLNALASTAYYARVVQVAEAAARALGREDDAGRYAALVERIRADFGARFLSADGAYREKPDEPFLHTAQILPLAFGLVPDARRGPLASRLAEDIRVARGGNAWVGILGATHVLPVLSAFGHNDTAFGFATQTDEPSWGYWTDVARFTALGEHWPADTRSRNHHFFGAIVQWLYEDLAGFRPLEPGYARVEFRPEIPAAGLDYVKASFESVRGTVGTSWRRTGEGLTLEVTVPANATGRVHVPAEDASRIRETATGRTLAAAAAPGVRVAGVEHGRVVLDVGSGTYRFEVGAPSGAGR